MNVSLTPRLEDFVRRKVASGLYNNASEVVREGLRLLVAREGVAPAAAGALDKERIRARLAALEGPLRERGIASLSLFGSAVRGEARPDSDIDVLVDVRTGLEFSLIDLVSIKDLLEQRLGRSVDVVTRAGIEPGVREAVLSEAERVF